MICSVKIENLHSPSLWKYMHKYLIIISKERLDENTTKYWKYLCLDGKNKVDFFYPFLFSKNLINMIF